MEDIMHNTLDQYDLIPIVWFLSSFEIFCSVDEDHDYTVLCQFYLLSNTSTSAALNPRKLVRCKLRKLACSKRLQEQEVIWKDKFELKVPFR